MFTVIYAVLFTTSVFVSPALADLIFVDTITYLLKYSAISSNLIQAEKNLADIRNSNLVGRH